MTLVDHTNASGRYRAETPWGPLAGNIRGAGWWLP